MNSLRVFAFSNKQAHAVCPADSFLVNLNHEVLRLALLMNAMLHRMTPCMQRFDSAVWMLLRSRN